MSGAIITRPIGPSSGGGGGGGVSNDEHFLVLTASANLVNERILTASAGIKFTDNGPGSTLVAELSWVPFETPSGDIDGVNKIFSLSKKPSPPESLQVFKRGMFMASGSNCEDYILSGSTITFHDLQTPTSGSIIVCRYFI